MLLDGNFDEDWGDCLYLEPVLHHGEYGKHTVEIRVLPDEFENAEPLYLIGFDYRNRKLLTGKMEEMKDGCKKTI